jgi:hypothetical protein
MAVPNILVSLGGVSFPIPQVGTSPWGQNVTNWIVAASGANGFVQLSGGSQPLTADLNFGASFGVISIYFKSRSSNIAAAGVLRLANSDTINWRNFGNTADDILFPGITANNQSADDLYYKNGTSGVFTQLTGNPAAYYAASGAIAWTAAQVTVTSFNTLGYDTDLAYNAGTGIFTVPANKGGLYYVTASVGMAAGAATAYTLAIFNNSTAVFTSRTCANAAGIVTAAVSGIVALAAGATIKVTIQGAINAGFASATDNFIVIKRIA